jgi:prepilin-type N-terminal cleavage/methylation domain-containing protein
MTLLELLVVVAILAVLASVAIQSTSEVGNQTRYDATQKSLAVFRDAVLGPQGQTTPDGSPLITGFVADMGRPPRSRGILHPDLGTLYGLSELHSEVLPASLQAYGLYAATTTLVATNGTIVGVSSTNTTLLYDTNLRIPAGWRGPYVRKPSTEGTMVDGWNKWLVSRLDLGTSLAEMNTWPTMLLAFRTNSTTQPFALPEDGNYTPIIDEHRDIAGVFAQSGFDGAPVGTDAYSGRFYSAINQNEYQVPLTVVVNCASTNALTAIANLTVMLYGPNPEVRTDLRPIRVWAQQAPFNASYNVSFTFDNAYAPTMGNRVLRAILRVNSTTFVRSRVIYFPVRPGVQNINIPLP